MSFISQAFDTVASGFLPGSTPKTAKTVSSRSIGSVVLDTVLKEDHTSTLNISDNPVESGALIADHAVVQPKEVAIHGIMIDYEPPARAKPDSIAYHLRELVELSQKSEFIPEEIKLYTKETIRIANESLGTYAAIAHFFPNARPIAPWMVDFFMTDPAEFAEKEPRVAQAYQNLIKAQKSGETITVTTGLCTYSNMLIHKLNVMQNKDGSAEFDLTLREIFVVDTQKVSGVQVPQTKPAGKRSGGRSNKQRAQKRSNGKRNCGWKKSNKSFMSYLFKPLFLP